MKLQENISKKLSFWIKVSYLHGLEWLIPSQFKINPTKPCLFTELSWDSSLDAPKLISTWVCSISEQITSKQQHSHSKRQEKSIPTTHWSTHNWELSTTNKKITNKQRKITSSPFKSVTTIVPSGSRKLSWQISLMHVENFDNTKTLYQISSNASV